MATIERKISDLSQAEDGVTTLDFALDGTGYEIDLTGQEADGLRGVLADYVSHARKATSGKAPAGKATRISGTRTTSADKEQNQAIRGWARKNGSQVSERGRIPAGVIAAYNSNDVAALQAMIRPVAAAV